MQGFLPYQIADHVGVLPLLEQGTILHMLRNVVATLVPTDTDLFAFIESAAKHPSWQERDTNIGQRWQGSSGMITLVVLHKVLLSVKDAIAAVHDARPILSCFVHSHLVLLPIRLRLEGLQRLLFRAIRAEHVWLSRQTLAFVICHHNG